MKKRIATCGTAALLCMAMIAGGCADNNDAAPGGTHQGHGTQAQDARPGRTQVESVSLAENASLPIVVSGGRKYVRADDLVRLLGYNSQWDDKTNTMRIGDYDPIFAFKAGSAVAVREGHRIRMPMAAIMANGSLLVPVCGVDELFRQDMTFNVTDRQLVVHANNDTAGTMSAREADDNDAAVPDEFRFSDSPYDSRGSNRPDAANRAGGPSDAAPGNGGPTNVPPGNVGPPDAAPGNVGPSDVAPGNGGPSNAAPGNGAPTGPAPAPGTAAGSPSGATAGAAQATPAGSRVDVAGLIQRAKQYIGVPYRFGAGPYAQTRRFDCSSYTQYVFSQSGLNLPRSSRQQATQGTYVGRQELRPGDLLFFNTPARFKNRSTVGHVGIYIGNGQMINANPSRGVQILDINSGYWARTYLFARRVI